MKQSFDFGHPLPFASAGGRGVFLQGQFFTYNEYGDVKTAAQRIAGVGFNKYTYTYRYDTGVTTGDLTAVNQLKASGSLYYTYNNYDTLNRISSEQVNLKVTGGTDATVLTRGYTYRDVIIDSVEYTTTQVAGVSYSGLNSSAYSYTYDARGNITSVSKNNSPLASYEYDDLGQLVRENNVAANKTWTYTYDSRGNITSKKTYAYSNGTLGTLQNSVTYTYPGKSDSTTWKDLLVKYDGEYTSYDEIGNPYQYYNGSTYYLTWSDGRKLTSGTKGTTSFSYVYNSDGLRTQKTVNGATYNYYWQGSLLSAMTCPAGTFKFYYDAKGTPYAVKAYDAYLQTESTYLYVTNLQGDPGA